MSSTPTANDRFKQSSRSSFWIGLIVATVFHAIVFMGTPAVALTAPGDDVQPATLVNIPPDVRVPEPPPPIRRPAEPVIADHPVPDDRTIDRTIPEDWSRSLAPPAPVRGEQESARFITPMDIAPRLLNAAAVQDALQEHYPPILRDARIGGVVSVLFHLDAEGGIVETRVAESSGYEALDRAALEVARIMEFTPAQNRDRRIPVWVAMNILFEVR